jgi:agmatine deiminase
MTNTSSPARMRVPGEWAPHDLTLIAWPGREEAWVGTTLEQARVAHAAVVAAIAAFEPVLLVAHPDELEDARRRVPSENVEVVGLTIDDSWIRDSGPLILTGRDAEGRPARAGVDFRFNAWGKSFVSYDADDASSRFLLERLGIERIASPIVLEGGSIAVDGAGTLVTTEQCLLNPNRNPDLSREQIEQELRERLGVERIVWLGRGLLEDLDTDGHVDNICAFLPDGRALAQTAPAGDPNHEHLQANAQVLRDAGLDVVELDLLPRTQDGKRGDVVIPYTNFYTCNGAAIVPVTDLDPDMNEEALRRLRELLPGREVVGVPAGLTLALGGGGIHCITQQIPSIPAELPSA